MSRDLNSHTSFSSIRFFFGAAWIAWTKLFLDYSFHVLITVWDKHRFKFKWFNFPLCITIKKREHNRPVSQRQALLAACRELAVIYAWGHWNCHYDEIFTTGCNGSCQSDNVRCSQWWKLGLSPSIYQNGFKKTELGCYRHLFHFGKGLVYLQNSTKHDYGTRNWSSDCQQMSWYLTMWAIGTVYDGVIKWKHIRETGPLRGESTGDRWIPLIKASNVEFWCVLWWAPEQTIE